MTIIVYDPAAKRILADQRLTYPAYVTHEETFNKTKFKHFVHDGKDVWFVAAGDDLTSRIPRVITETLLKDGPGQAIPASAGLLHAEILVLVDGVVYSLWQNGSDTASNSWLQCWEQTHTDKPSILGSGGEAFKAYHVEHNDVPRAMCLTARHGKNCGGEVDVLSWCDGSPKVRQWLPPYDLVDSQIVYNGAILARSHFSIEPAGPVGPTDPLTTLTVLSTQRVAAALGRSFATVDELFAFAREHADVIEMLDWASMAAHDEMVARS